MKEVNVLYAGEKLFTINVDGNSVEEILEKTFEGCNYGSPRLNPEFRDLKVRSLSVNDFVRVDDQWYQCAAGGWNKVTESLVDEIEELVVDHPRYQEYGGWLALNEVMWEKRKTI